MTCFEVKKYVFVCNGCDKNTEHIGYAGTMPEGWVSEAPVFAGDGYTNLPNITAAIVPIRHWCPDCAAIKDVIE